MTNFYLPNVFSKCFLSFLFLTGGWCSPLAGAQNWPWVTSFAGTGSETISGLVTKPNDDLLVVCGHFQNELIVDNISETSVGNTDAFVAGLNAAGQPAWILTGASAGADKSMDIGTDSENNIYWAGEYWFNGVFGNLNLTTTKSSKAIFLVKATDTGTPVWARSIEGTGNKILGAMATDLAGNSYLSGNFSDSLFIENTVLTATAEKDFFLIKISPTGNLLWARQAGIDGEIRPEGMKIQGTKIAITGSMRGEYIFGVDTIGNNTNDSDAFLVVYNTAGENDWARKIGGVNEQNGSDVAFDSEGNIYAVGSFFGVIRLRTDLEIQSPNLNDNLYFVKYDATGFALLARSIGDLDVELSESLVFTDGYFYWSGFFRNNFAVDGFELQTAGDDFNSFILKIDTQATVEDVYLVTSPTTALLSELTVDNQGRIYGGGAINGTAAFGDQTERSATDGFDGFVGQLTPLVVGTNNFLPLSLNILPNPATDYFQIESAMDDLEIQVFSMDGREILKTQERWINCQGWPEGIYVVRINGVAVRLLSKKD